MAKTVFKLQIAEIARLSKQYRYWKIHWFGGLSLNLTTYEPQIDVYLVPLISAESATKKTGKLIFNGSYEFSEMRFVQIGIGHLPIVGLGTIFCDGRPFSRPKYVTKEFTIRITASKQQYIPVKASWGKHKGRSSYYVPSKQYRSFPGALSVHSLNESPNKTEQLQSSGETFHGKLLLINFDESERPLVSNRDNPLYSYHWQLERLGEIVDKEPETMFPVHGLIINPVEMVRFYYANSSQLYQEILTGGLSNDPNRVFNPAHTIQPDAEGYNGFLRLTKYVKDVDAPLIARLAFDLYARRQAAQIYASSLNSGAMFLSKQEGTAQSRFFEAFFPFENQETKLKVHGTYLQSGNRVYFLVLWIESCTAPFPYQNFDYWRDNPGNKTADVSEISRDATLPPKLVPTEKPPGPDDKFYDPDYTPVDVTEYIKTRHPKETTLQSEISPSVSRDELELITGARNKFPDLKKKKWEKKTDNASREIIQVEDPELDQVFIGISEDTETGATGPKSGTEPVTPVSFAEDFQDEAKENTLVDQPLFDIPPDEDLTYQPTERRKSEAEDSETKGKAGETDEAERQPGGEKAAGISESTSGEKLPEDEQTAESLAALERFPIVQGICRLMTTVEPSLTASIVEMTRDGEKVYRETPSRFPTYWKHRANPVQGYQEKPIYEALAYIIEIKSREEKFAYLFSIEPLVNAAGKTEREYRMFLCFDKDLFKEFTKSSLLRVLAIGEESDGNWLPKDNTAKVGRHRFNHNADSDEEYAKRIAGVLKKAHMLTKPKAKDKSETSEQDEPIIRVDNVVIAQADSNSTVLV